jgi:uncharacterized membrane protein
MSVLEGGLSDGDPIRPGPGANSLPGSGHRIASIDVLRGLVMVLMALDHTRVFFSNSMFDPTDLGNTTAAYFATRWVTHFCAPVFVFLAGTAVFMRLKAEKDKASVARFLIFRGLMLVILEVSVVNIGWIFSVPEFIFLQVIWVLGVSMIVLAGLIYLPLAAIVVIGLVMVVGHNFLDNVNAEDLGAWSTLWKILHQSKGFEVFGFPIWPSYPLIPWIGVMALGYAFGSLFGIEEQKRKRWLIGLGTALTAGFVVLRFGNFYGDPEPWIGSGEGLKSWLSFFNTDKYPPSLQFLLMTMGPAILFLACAGRISGLIRQVLTVFGRVPLFFYLVHIYFIHMVALFVGVASGFSIKVFLDGYWHLPRAEGYGYELGWLYLIWVLFVATLYPICNWYAGLKSNSKNRLYSYL